MLLADSWKDWVTPGILALVGAILTGAAVTVQRGWRLVSKCQSVFDTVERLPAQVEELKKQVDVTAEVVKRELTANGGGSLKDAVTSLRLRDASIEAKHRLWSTFMNVMAWEADANGYLIWASSRLLRELQRQDDEVFGDGWRSAIAPEHARKVTDEWDVCVKQRRPYAGVFALQRADKTTFVVEVETHCLRHVNDVLGYVTVAKHVDAGGP